LYERLRLKRKESNTTVKVLRELIGLKGDPAYFKKETGKTKFTVDEALLIADHFATSVEALFR